MVYCQLHFICGFLFQISSPAWWISQHFQKDNTNFEVWKFFQNWTPFLNWSGKRTRKWKVADNIPLFTHKMVRKFGQKRDFAKFHSKPKHQVFNIYKNGLRRVERALWISSGCNMRVWRPKTKKPPALLAIPWFWAVFWQLFNKKQHLVNKRSTFVD